MLRRRVAIKLFFSLDSFAHKGVFMKHILFLLCAFALHGLESADRNAIQNKIDHFTIAWNEYGGVGSSDFYAEDADFVNIFGMAFSGKEEIEARHVKIMETFLKGSKFEVVGLKLREAKTDVVVAQVDWKVSGIQNGAPDMLGIFTHIFLKNGDEWQIASTQNTKK